ncbi:MAG: 50S ribosomal protein L9 [Haemophilus parainfluenzae]|jgi:ribosomal protein L9|nr:MAG: 50S ribosomal protein L9 [Haemophilus parainfluenzae]
MEVILLERVGDLGDLGKVLQVKNGYARNYLIPQGKAKRATKANLAAFEAQRAELEARQAEIFKNAEEKKAKVDGQTLEISQKAGIDGRLFGSVTTIDIANALEQFGVPTERAHIRLPDGPLKNVGEYTIDVNYHHDVVATIHVVVTAADA